MPTLGGGCRRQALELLAIDLDRAAVGGDRARGDVHQRRLARPVFAEQGVDLAGGHLEGHVGQRPHRSVALGDARQDDPRLPGGHRLVPSFDGDFEFVHGSDGWLVGYLESRSLPGGDPPRPPAERRGGP